MSHFRIDVARVDEPGWATVVVSIERTEEDYRADCMECTWIRRHSDYLLLVRAAVEHARDTDR